MKRVKSPPLLVGGDMQELPEEIEAVYTILSFLREIDGLPDTPINVEFTREGYPSVHPCRKPKEDGKIDIDQIEWARENGKWWFLGPIETLKIGIPRKKKWAHFKADERILTYIAKNAGFELELFEV